MLKLSSVTKEYYVGDQVIHALNGVSVTFRQHEFVSILGQSGCGKTTLMNVIGGLDKATSGDIVLDGVSTADYKDVDWDDFRNRRIGFVFQNYNLIQHLNVLTNVELALTISGITGEERVARAKRALDRVGLKEQYSKRPNQLSGGQMQRVAIARAIVNEPDILLADEPTGAIDSETSVQIMDILKEISAEKLVIMVTHNADLAQEYSTRIIRILDGRIVSDDNPFEEDTVPTIATATEVAEISQTATTNINDAKAATDAVQTTATAQIDNRTIGAVKPKRGLKRRKGTSMSFFTAVKLSWNNLINKRGRSVLTAVAGSIGIISIALILAVNNGFSVYIDDFERQSMAKYPITASSGENSVVEMFEDFLGGDELTGDTMDISSILGIFAGDDIALQKYTAEQLVYVYGKFSGTFSAMINSMSKQTDISRFKTYLEDPANGFSSAWGSVKYDYSINLNVYRYDAEKEIYRQLNPLGESDTLAPLLSAIEGEGGDAGTRATIQAALNKFAFWDEIIADDNTLNEQYDVLAGKMPETMNEIVLVVDAYNQITDFDKLALDEMGTADLMAAMVDPLNLVDFTSKFSDVLDNEYYVLPTSAAYQYDGALYKNLKEAGGVQLATALSDKAVKVKISGIIRPKEGVDGGCINGVVGYTSALGDYIIDDANSCDFVTAQKAAYDEYVAKLQAAIPVNEKLQNGVHTSDLPIEEQQILFAAATAKLYNLCTGECMSESTSVLKDYATLMTSLNVRDLNKPSFIYFYPSAIRYKSLITSFIDTFNAARTVEEEQAEADAEANGTAAPTTTYIVEYSDDLDSIVTELNTLVKTITYILIAVALVSVLVTMLLIAIIMYISVQDRTREIGILRSLGARKLDISNIFNVETMLLGFASGILGMVLSLILRYPANLIFKSTLGISELMMFTWWHPLVLIFGAVVITVVSGLIPAILAAKKDPVIALRTE